MKQIKIIKPSSGNSIVVKQITIQCITLFYTAILRCVNGKQIRSLAYFHWPTCSLQIHIKEREDFYQLFFLMLYDKHLYAKWVLLVYFATAIVCLRVCGAWQTLKKSGRPISSVIAKNYLENIFIRTEDYVLQLEQESNNNNIEYKKSFNNSKPEQKCLIWVRRN